jgi:internalin A
VLEGVEGATGEWVLELGGFTMLTSLCLVHCTVTDADVLAAGTLPALTTLSVRRCRKVTDVAVGTLSGLTGLTMLVLAGCHKLTDVAMGTLSSFTGLTVLSLSGSKVTDVGVAALSDLTALSELYLAAAPTSPPRGSKHSAPPPPT